MISYQSLRNYALLVGLLFTCLNAVGQNKPRIEKVYFESEGVKLAGSIVIPTETNIKAAMVFVHGSGKQTRSFYWAEQFAKNGIASLVYDKRGVGESGGTYENERSVGQANLELLANDALMAFQLLNNHERLKNIPIGFSGISQAGWIIPLSAEATNDADFIVLWSGPVTKVSEEDIFSKYTADLDKKRVPPYLEALNARKTQYVWPAYLGNDTNPIDSLLNIDVPSLWIFGNQDGSVPVDLSIQRLELLIQKGKPFEYVLFSGVGHNNMKQTLSTASAWIENVAASSER